MGKKIRTYRRTGASRARLSGAESAIAFAWGAGEATAFFLVPDIWLTRIALRGLRPALRATVPTLAGALAGGVVTYAWGARRSRSASRRALAALPAISETMVDGVERQLAEVGNRALLVGPTKGIPYKIYARTAGLRGDSLAVFLLWSIPARMARFIVVPTAVAGIAHVVRNQLPGMSQRTENIILCGGWSAFYAWFFATVGRE